MDNGPTALTWSQGVEAAGERRGDASPQATNCRAQSRKRILAGIGCELSILSAQNSSCVNKTQHNSHQYCRFRKRVKPHGGAL